MNCGFCFRSFEPEQQSPVCPHLNLDPPKPRPGGPRLRPEVQREIEDAFNLRNIPALNAWIDSQNYAARFYARMMLNRIEELDKSEKLRSNLQQEE